MRTYLLYLFSFLGVGRVAAQQNLFNVPSSDITIKSKPFFQQQINVSQELVQLNSTFCWGLGGEAEIGINIIGLDVNTTSTGSVFQTNSDALNPPVYPFYTINFQKAFTLNKILKLAVGTQTGYSKGFHLGTYTYSNLVTALSRSHSKIISGLYYGSESFLGAGDRSGLLPSDSDPIGFQLGVEQEVIKEKLLLIAEHISGTHSMGVTALGAAYFFTHHWVLSCGYQIANTGNSSANSLVVEFTFVPSAGISKHIFRKGHHEADEAK